MKGSRARRLLGAAVIAVFLAPVAWTKESCADDWADETAPTDNPETSAPDLYANKRVEDGVQSMPDAIPSTPAQDFVEVLPTAHRPLFAEALRPNDCAFRQAISGSPRAPPSLPAL